MKYVQLEFDFVNSLKKRNWFTEHFRPQIGWNSDGQEGYWTKPEEYKWDSVSNIWKNVLDHVKIGFVFKWKF